MFQIAASPINEMASIDKSKSELSFEYLISKDKLQWITITSPQVRRSCLFLAFEFIFKSASFFSFCQAILMSICLQGMVEELLMKKDGLRGRYRRPRSSGVHKGNWSYMKRDGSSHQISSVGAISDSPSSETYSHSTQVHIYYQSPSFLSDRNARSGAKSSGFSRFMRLLWICHWYYSFAKVEIEGS